MSDTNYSRHVEWQRRLAPFSGIIVCAVGLLFLVSTIAPNAGSMPADMTVKERIMLGLVFEAVGLLFLRWGLKKTSAPKKWKKGPTSRPAPDYFRGLGGNGPGWTEGEPSGGDQWQAFIAVAAVDAEIPGVRGEDLGGRVQFTQADEAGIRELHPPSVTDHELAQTRRLPRQ